MIQGLVVKKLGGVIFKMVMKQIGKKFDLDGIQKYVNEPNELDDEVSKLKKELKSLKRIVKKLNK